MMYCPACDGTQVEIADNGTCADCGSAVVDLTSIMQAAEKRGAERTIAKFRAWATKQMDMCKIMQDSEQSKESESLFAYWCGAEMAMDVLISYLANGLKTEVQS